MNVLSLRRLNEWTPRMKHRFYIITLSLFALAVTVRAQHFQEQPKSIKGDSIKTDFEEWLRNAPPHFYVAFQIIGKYLFLINCYISNSYTISREYDDFWGKPQPSAHHSRNG